MRIERGIQRCQLKGRKAIWLREDLRRVPRFRQMLTTYVHCLKDSKARTRPADLLRRTRRGRFLLSRRRLSRFRIWRIYARVLAFAATFVAAVVAACVMSSGGRATPILLWDNGGRQAQQMTTIWQLKKVIGPSGRQLTLADLPPTNLKHWLPRHKADIVTAVRGGLITADEICKRYRLSLEEFSIWEQALDSHGVDGLRVTRIRTNRGERLQTLLRKLARATVPQSLTEQRQDQRACDEESHGSQ